MPQQPETEEDVLDLIAREEACRRKRGYPEHIIRSAQTEIREAFAAGQTDGVPNLEFVGCIGGLQWSPDNGWE